jgi:hypothetical protein
VRYASLTECCHQFAAGQTRKTYGGDYGPETYNVGDQWGGRQI